MPTALISTLVKFGASDSASRGFASVAVEAADEIALDRDSSPALRSRAFTGGPEPGGFPPPPGFCDNSRGTPSRDTSFFPGPQRDTVVGGRLRGIAPPGPGGRPRRPR